MTMCMLFVEDHSESTVCSVQYILSLYIDNEYTVCSVQYILSLYVDSEYTICSVRIVTIRR